MQKQFNNFNKYQYSPEHITRLLNDDKSDILVKFLDGSAYECWRGNQIWVLNGNYHRTDGPAVIYPNGYQAWYLNGKRHRTDGPAVIYGNGAQRWCLNDKEMTEKEHAKAIQQL